MISFSVPPACHSLKHADAQLYQEGLLTFTRRIGSATSAVPHLDAFSLRCDIGLLTVDHGEDFLKLISPQLRINIALFRSDIFSDNMGGVCVWYSWTCRPVWPVLIFLATAPFMLHCSESPAAVVGKMYPRGNHWAVGKINL